MFMVQLSSRYRHRESSAMNAEEHRGAVDPPCTDFDLAMFAASYGCRPNWLLSLIIIIINSQLEI